ncbi:MAG: hypothetical protein Q7V88_00025 [Actinomycetota bacterium]|nr:hypothetical protein [Actinomycetota bacterium]
MNHTVSLPAPGTSRRQFLLAGSAAVAGALLLRGDLLGSPSGLELLAADAGPRIPVSFVEGSGGARSLAEALAGTRRAVPAAGMQAGASLAGRSARVAVQGFASAHHTASSAGQADVLLDAHVPSPAHHDQTIPFYAFTYRSGPATSQSSPSKLRVRRGDGLRVGFQLGGAGGGSSTVFTSRPQRGLPTLQPGVYLFGLEQGMWASASTLPAADDAAWATLPSLVVVVEAEAAE